MGRHETKNELPQASKGPAGLFERWRMINSLDLPGELVHLLIAILHYQGDNGHAWVKTATLAEDLKVTRNGLNRRISRLAELGIDARHDEGFGIDFDALSRWKKPVGDKAKRCPQAPG